jgi:hypothetical protein
LHIWTDSLNHYSQRPPLSLSQQTPFGKSSKTAQIWCIFSTVRRPQRGQMI